MIGHFDRQNFHLPSRFLLIFLREPPLSKLSIKKHDMTTGSGSQEEAGETLTDWSCPL